MERVDEGRKEGGNKETQITTLGEQYQILIMRMRHLPRCIDPYLIVPSDISLQIH